MTTDLRDRANARLDAALRDRELADPRGGYRTRLRALRETRPELFERATRHYEEHVLPALAAGDDAIDTWIDYGRVLAEMIGPGRVLAIDGTGVARPYSPPLPAGALVLHVPYDPETVTLPLAEPAAPSAAQRAAYDLLVRGRLALESST